MEDFVMPKDCAKQWPLLLEVLSRQEGAVDRTVDGEIVTMSYFCNNVGIRRIFLQWLAQMKASYAKKSAEDTALKDDDLSEFYRQRGNDKFRFGDYEECYFFYCKSVAYAKQDSPMFPLAVANRSAASIHLERFRDCLNDISLAFEYGYPEKNRHKLLIRRAECLIRMRDLEPARRALDEAISAARKNLSPSRYEDFHSIVMALEKGLAIAVPDNNARGADEIPTCYRGENPDFVAASNAVQIRRSEEADEGRCVYTKTPVKCGDVLFSEEPYAWVALREGSVCENCCTGHVNFLPCRTCSRVVYCDEQCRTRAQELFHKWECVGAQSNLFQTIGIAHLAMRVLLITAANEGFPSICERDGFEAHTTAKGLFEAYAAVDDVDIYTRGAPAFFRMFNLVTNFDKMENEDYIQYALTATLLTIYLENYTTFFDHLMTKIPYPLSRDEVRLFAAALMFRALAQLVCNGHAALNLETVKIPPSSHVGKTVTEKVTRRATAIYPSAAILNHSCDPNIVAQFRGNRLIILADRNIPQGKEVFNCYGPHWTRVDAKSRARILRQQYKFVCKCTACLDPEKSDFAARFSAYRCQQCDAAVSFEDDQTVAACPDCSSKLRLSKVLEAIRAADEVQDKAMKELVLQKRCEIMEKSVKMKKAVYYKYNIEVTNAVDFLARIYVDCGTYEESIKRIQENLRTIEYQYGPNSSEVGHELKKLSDVMLERMRTTEVGPRHRSWCEEAFETVRKAADILERRFGEWESTNKELRHQESMLFTYLHQHFA